MKRIECIALDTMREAEVPEGTVLSLGNFDGVHLGHRALLRRTLEERGKRFSGAACGVFCFRDPSSDYLTGDSQAHLCTLEERLGLFAGLGMEYAFVADFPVLRGMPAEDFVKEILIEEAHCRAAVCGYNHRYGKGGSGTPELLSGLLAGRVFVEGEVHWNGAPVSSTRIRTALRSGDAESAEAMLCHPYTVASVIGHGKGLGHTIGFPTVNQNFPRGMLIPAHGVYATLVQIDGRFYRGITNVGVRPTVESAGCVNCETHLLDTCADLYGKTAAVSFLHFLREEKKFESVAELEHRIASDRESAERYFAILDAKNGEK